MRNGRELRTRRDNDTNAQGKSRPPSLDPHVSDKARNAFSAAEAKQANRIAPYPNQGMQTATCCRWCRHVGEHRAKTIVYTGFAGVDAGGGCHRATWLAVGNRRRERVFGGCAVIHVVAAGIVLRPPAPETWAHICSQKWVHIVAPFLGPQTRICLHGVPKNGPCFETAVAEKANPRAEKRAGSGRSLWPTIANRSPWCTDVER